MKQRTANTITLLLFAIAALLLAQVAIAVPAITENDIKSEVKTLSSKEYAGRYWFSLSAVKTSEYLAKMMTDYGLTPIENSSYFQEADTFIIPKIAPGYSIKLTLDGKVSTLKFSRDIFLINKDLTNIELNCDNFTLYYDSLSDKPDQNMLIIPIRKQGFEEYVEVSSLIGSINEALAKKPKCIVIPDIGLSNYEIDYIIELNPGVEIPIFVLSESTYKAILKANGFNSIEELYTVLDSGKNPVINFGLSAKLAQTPEKFKANNVAGILKGNDPQKNQSYILIGGHYDHVGVNELNPNIYYPGADDNASGTVMIMELAEKLSDTKPLKHSVIFALFTGEETGLNGARSFYYYLNKRKIDVSVMINLDMVGHFDNKLLYLGIYDKNNVLTPHIDKLFGSKYNIDREFADTVSGDYDIFRFSKIPTLFVFTGMHDHYHTPTDTWDTLNYPGMVTLGNQLYDFIIQLDNTLP